jgi:riboflavin synthase
VFTGIVEVLGRVARAESASAGRRLGITAAFVPPPAIGDSISVNGCCLTVVASSIEGFEVEVVRETLDRSTTGELEVGDSVNLERAMRLDARLDGHLVQGHVDGVGTVRTVADEGGARRVRIAMPVQLAPYVAEKGSIAVDGTSLTVTRADHDTFEVALIPHTLERTVASRYAIGVRVNLEADIVARYVARLMATGGRT